MNVFIVDDSSQIRKDLVDLLADEKRIDVVGQAGSVREALAGLNAVLTEAVILDISLPDGSGVEILKFIRLRGWDLCVIVLTGNPYDALLTEWKALGAVAVLDKLDEVGQVLKALLPRLERSRL